MANWVLYVSLGGTNPPMLGLGRRMLEVLGSIGARAAFLGVQTLPPATCGVPNPLPAGDSHAPSQLLAGIGSFSQIEQRKKEGKKKNQHKNPKKEKINSVYLFLNGEIK